jgi:crotonobetainyl-CoA:carnitine CoA-transferase CaiB-like acyl-CoA transferase
MRAASMLRYDACTDSCARLILLPPCVDRVRLASCTVESPESIATTDAHLLSRELTLSIPFEGEQPLTVAKSPLRMTNLHSVALPGPRLGEHNEEILGPLRKKRHNQSRL